MWCSGPCKTGDVMLWLANRTNDMSILMVVASTKPVDGCANKCVRWRIGDPVGPSIPASLIGSGSLFAVTLPHQSFTHLLTKHVLAQPPCDHHTVLDAAMPRLPPLNHPPVILGMPAPVPNRRRLRQRLHPQPLLRPQHDQHPLRAPPSGPPALPCTSPTGACPLPAVTMHHHTQ